MFNALDIFNNAAEQYALVGLRADEANILEPFLKNGKKRILVAGAGAGRTSIALSKMGHSVVGFDFSSTMIELAKKQAEQQNANVTHILLDMKNMSKFFTRETFDIIFFPFHSIDYIPEKIDRGHVLSSALHLLSNRGAVIWNSHNRLFHRTFFQWLKTKQDDYGLLKSKEGIIRTYTVFIPSEKKWLLNFLPNVMIKSRYSLIPKKHPMKLKERIARIISPIADKSMYFVVRK